jgi:hypothetical protein
VTWILDSHQLQGTAKNSLTAKAGGKTLGVSLIITCKTSSVSFSIHLNQRNSDGMCAADEDDADDDSEVESDTIALEYDVNGYPLLPSMKDLSLEQMKQYIRLYATVIYRECSFL